MEKTNTEKAAILYNEIDRNKLFASTVPNKEDRSKMNVTFVMAPEYAELEKEFRRLHARAWWIGALMGVALGFALGYVVGMGSTETVTVIPLAPGIDT